MKQKEKERFRTELQTGFKTISNHFCDNLPKILFNILVY